MVSHFKSVNWAQAAPRMLADLVVVHFSMVAALAISSVYTLARGNGIEAQALVSEFARYHILHFSWISPLFPLIFFLSGFYTHTRGYAGRYKKWAILRGVGVAVMLFLIANYLLFGNISVGRSVALPFVILAGLGLSGARLLKAELEKRYVLKSTWAPVLSVSGGRVLVVGGAGYIGSLAVERLLSKGYSVRVLDSLLYGEESLRTAKDHPRFELQVGDCRNIQDVVKAVRNVDCIIHLAAIVGDPACEQDRDSAIEINYAATRMLVEVAKGNGVARFVFASSCSVYGASDFEVDERDEPQPLSLYGRTKVDSEDVVLRAKGGTFHPTVLRFATVFGLGYRPRFDLVVNLLTAKARQEGLITVYNGTQWRPFIHVRDVVDAIVRVLEAPARLVCGEIFNVGDSRLNCTLSGVAECIREVFPDTRVEHRVNPDRRNYRVNFAKLHRSIGFEASHSLRDGIEELKHAFDERLIEDYTDVRYHNQRFLLAAGGIGHKDELDGLVMAAFATPVNHRAMSASV